MMAQCVWSKPQNFAREISFQKLKAPLASGSAVVSPDGRSVAFVNGNSKARGTVLYDCRSGSSWMDSKGGTPAAWSEDSRVCLSRTEKEWRLLQPERRENHAILNQSTIDVPGYIDYQPDGVAAWAPQTQRLAVVDSIESLRFWDGKYWTPSINWGRILKFPDWYRGEVQPFDLTWSRDDRLLTIRFYGRAERAPGSALHTVVFSVSGRRIKDIWGGDTGEVAWLDGRRMMFKDDDDGSGLATDLVVVEPRSKRRRVWKSDVMAWALSPRRDFVCALLGNGDLVRSSTQKPRWEVMQKKALSQRVVKSSEISVWLRLDISPRGDMVAVSRVEGGRGIWLFSALPKKPWTIYWKAPTAEANLVGWAQGRSLPMVALKMKEDEPSQLAQLRKFEPRA